MLSKARKSYALLFAHFCFAWKENWADSFNKRANAKGWEGYSSLLKKSPNCHSEEPSATRYPALPVFSERDFPLRSE